MAKVSTISRRDVIRRGAAAGVALWAAPAISSVSLRHAGAVGSDPDVIESGTDFCESGRPKTLSFTYTGDSCAASNACQGASATCSQPAASPLPNLVHIHAAGDDKDPDKHVYFAGEVAIGGSFQMTGTEKDGEFRTNAFVTITDPATDEVLQTLSFHTSCSVPLCVGDRFGSLRLTGGTF